MPPATRKSTVIKRLKTTGAATRAAIRTSPDSIRTLAARYGIDPKTVAKWRARPDGADLPRGPRHWGSTVLTHAEEAMCVGFRRHAMLPLDDCLYALQLKLPHLTRSALHRALSAPWRQPSARQRRCPGRRRDRRLLHRQRGGPDTRPDFPDLHRLRPYRAASRPLTSSNRKPLKTERVSLTACRGDALCHHGGADRGRRLVRGVGGRSSPSVRRRLRCGRHPPYGRRVGRPLGDRPLPYAPCAIPAAAAFRPMPIRRRSPSIIWRSSTATTSRVGSRR